MQIDPRPAEVQASDILLITRNDYALNNDCIAIRKLSPAGAFIKYSNIITRINSRYISLFNRQFTIEGMAAALILLNDHYNNDE